MFFFILFTRCPQWPQLPSGCYLTTDPNDQCCKKPICEQKVLTPPPSYVPTPKPTYYPGQPTPSPQPTQPPTPYTFTLPPAIQTGYSSNYHETFLNRPLNNSKTCLNRTLNNPKTRHFSIPFISIRMSKHILKSKRV